MTIYMSGSTYGIKETLKKSGWKWDAKEHAWKKESDKSKEKLAEIFNRKYGKEKAFVYTYEQGFRFPIHIWASKAELEGRVKGFHKLNAEMHDEVFAESQR